MQLFVRVWKCVRAADGLVHREAAGPVCPGWALADVGWGPDSWGGSVTFPWACGSCTLGPVAGTGLEKPSDAESHLPVLGAGHLLLFLSIYSLVCFDDLGETIIGEHSVPLWGCCRLSAPHPTPTGLPHAITESFRGRNYTGWKSSHWEFDVKGPKQSLLHLLVGSRHRSVAEEFDSWPQCHLPVALLPPSAQPQDVRR